MDHLKLNKPQGRKVIFSMTNYIKRFVGVDPLTSCHLFYKLVTPILTYGCEIWGFYPSEYIEKVHRDFLRLLLHGNLVKQLRML